MKTQIRTRWSFKPRGVSPPHAGQSRNGFALLVSLLMMVLLTIVGIGLLTLSTVTLRQSGSARDMNTARNNARLAMMIALAELQKQTGPDQRITAAADVAGDTNGAVLAAGKAPLNGTSINSITKGLTAVQSGTRYWTGVWKNSSTAPATEILTKTPSPRISQWLISGNENLSGSSILTPANSACAVKSDGSAANTSTAAILVGASTVGTASASTLPRYVAAPLVGISRDSKTVGRYAWWVGDEGIKAKLNLQSDSSASTVATYQTLSAQRSGWEVVSGFSQYPPPGSSQQGRLNSVVSVSEMELLDPSVGTGNPSAINRTFHSATTDSFGVIADVLNGGLRLDLSAYLSKPLPTTTVPNVGNPPMANRNIVPNTVARSMQGPKWDRLRDFADLTKTLNNGKLMVKAATQVTESSISPVVVDLRVLMGGKLVPGTAADTYKVYPCAKVAISLANPYPYPLAWSSALELEFKSDTPAGNAPSRIWGLAGQPAFLPRGDGYGNPSDSALLSKAVFRIPADEIPPGEARAYTMGGPVVRPANDMNQVTIDLRAFAGSDASNFSNSLQMVHDSVNAAPVGGSLPAMDVRESWTTSLLTAELRSGAAVSGRTPILRRIERFELDNGYFSPTQRTITSADAKNLTRPFPLQLYSFQISQPGADYASLLPNPEYVGIRGSTLRTFADFNLQATRFRKTITSYNPAPYFMESTSDRSSLPVTAPGGDTGSAFTKNLAISPMAWGRSSLGPKRTILFSPPQTLISLAQFQHADLTGDDIYASVGHQPGNAFGNSYATPYVKRSLSFQSRNDYTIVGSSNQNDATAAATNYYDISYLLNTALWDTYFLSSIPASGTAEPLNKRMVKIDGNDTSADLRDGVKAASRLLINGSFNINSTDKDAWKALLAGTRSLKHPAEPAGGSNDAMFPRSLDQKSASKTPPTGSDDDSFSGYRRLTDAQIDALADEITRQVRQRGPFVSLSHFVNRALADVSRNKVLSRSGALQSALDISGINIAPDGSKNLFTGINLNEEKLNLQADGGAPRADMTGGRATPFPNNESDPVWAPFSRDLNPGAVASILADRVMLTDSSLRPEQGFRSTGIPGWVTQADVLQAIGPVISPRSDTFRIRSYGEALDPSTGQVTAKAWCEAVVQRTPLYVDAQNAATDRGAALNSLNQFFGRRYQIVSFRWLSPNEI